MKSAIPIIFSGLILSISGVTFAQDYQACSSNRNQAFQDLSAQMRVTIKNEVATEVSEKKFGWFSLVTQDNKMKQSVSSNMDIIGAKIENKENEVCVYLSEVNMVKNAKKHIEDITKLGKLLNKEKNFNIKNHHAKDIIEQVQTAGSLVVIAQHNEQIDPAVFSRYDKIINKAQTSLKQGAIRFVGDKANNLTFSGKNFIYGKSLSIAPGEYSYLADYNNACNQSDTISIKQGQETVIELERLELPKISFTSPGINSSSVRLTFNGKRIKISESITLDKSDLDNNCKGQFSWQADVSSQQDSGNVTLSAGEEKSITLDFLSNSTINSLKRLSSAWRSGDVIEVSGSLWLPSHDNKSKTDEKIGKNFASTQITFLSLDGALAYGPVLDYSTFNQVESFHMGYQVRFQMTESGASRMPFNVFEMPLIPFMYGQASLGYMAYADDQKKYQRTEQGSWKNYVMTSFGLGASLILSKDFSLTSKIQKNFSLDNGAAFYLGVGVRF